MASLKDIVIKQENNSKMDPIEIEVFITAPMNSASIKMEISGETLDPSSTDFIKTEPLDSACEDSSECDGMQLKQESCEMSNINIKPTSSICNDVLNNINIKHINNIETVREHFKGECDYCNRIYGCRQSLVKHIDKHVAQQTCVACNILFRTSTEFIDHVKSIHRSVEDVKYLNRPHVCDVCSKRFTESGYLELHQLTHTNNDRYVFVETLNGRLTGYDKSHQVNYNVSMYVCNVCDKTFTQSGHLKAHRLTHTNSRPWICDVCNGRFSLNGDLRRHKRTHTNERPYVCDTCDKTFTQSGSLKRHKRTHTNERPYVCNVCDKRFTESGHLRRHQRTHTNERPHACDVCEKRFTRSSNLRQHQQIHLQ